MNLGMLPPHGSPAYWRSIRQMIMQISVDVDRLWKSIPPDGWGGMPSGGGKTVITPAECASAASLKITFATDAVFTAKTSAPNVRSTVATIPAGTYQIPLGSINSGLIYNYCTESNEASYRNKTNINDTLFFTSGPSGAFGQCLAQCWIFCDSATVNLQFIVRVYGSGSDTVSQQAVYTLCGNAAQDSPVESGSVQTEVTVSGVGVDDGSSFVGPSTVTIEVSST